jgi:hypothetical protein
MNLLLLFKLSQILKEFLRIESQFPIPRWHVNANRGTRSGKSLCIE